MAKLRQALRSPQSRMLLFFALEGVLYQFATSVANFGNNLYATNLGASDTQIGLVQMIPNLIAVALLLPCGILSERMSSSRTMPFFLLVIMGLMFFGYGTVPAMGNLRMIFYFVFLGLSVGSMVLYNAQWQNFFGDVTAPGERNSVFTFRNRFMFLVGTLTPLLCGIPMSSVQTSEQKLLILRIFFYLSGAFLLLQAFVLTRIPCAKKQTSAVRISPRDLAEVIAAAAKSPAFRGFFGTVLFFYLGWHMDWSMWYLAEVQYVGMSESQLSLLSALICVTQLAAIGVFARLNEKKSVHCSIIYGGLALVVCSAAVIISCMLPEGLRVPVFMTLAVVGGMLQSCISLCTVQMLLEVAPEKNRSLTISLYTIVITLSNSLMPLLGVRMYTALGADRRALILFYSFSLIWRILSTLIFILRYRRIRRQKRPDTPAEAVPGNF